MRFRITQEHNLSLTSTCTVALPLPHCRTPGKSRESRQVLAVGELEGQRSREARVRDLETDRDALVASYAETVPEALDGLSGEERTNLYRMLQLEVRPDPEGYEVSGALCNSRPTGRRR